MDEEIRVPPAVTVHFERYALRVCEEAKLDFEQWAPKVHELVGHLQQLWREGVEQGLNTDDATDRAFGLFGSAQVVGKSMRGPWWQRYLLWQRYRGQRYAIFLSGAVFCAYISAIEVATSDPETYGPDTFGFYFLLSTSLNGVTALASLTLVQWRPTIRWPIARAAFALRWVVSPLIAIGLFNVIAPAFMTIPAAVVMVIADPAELPSAAFRCLTAGLGLLGASGYLSELLRFPHRRSAMLQRELLSVASR